MTTENAKQTVEKFFREMDAQRWELAQELVAPGLRAHVGGQDLDKGAWLAMGKMFFAAFPDGRHDNAAYLTAGDHVTVLGTWRGRHDGPMQGLPPTGRTVAMPFTSVFRTSEGRIVEVWIQFDSAVLMTQLGAMPAPGAQ
jgi:predicted ester cyclase